MITDTLIRRTFVIESINNAVETMLEKQMTAVQACLTPQTGRLLSSLRQAPKYTSSDIGTTHTLTFPSYLRWQDMNARRGNKQQGTLYNAPVYRFLVPSLRARIAYGFTTAIRQEIIADLLLIPDIDL